MKVKKLVTQKNQLLVSFNLVLLTFCLIGCDTNSAKTVSQTDTNSSENLHVTDRQLKIVTTIGMITDIVRNVVGDHATVEGIMGEDVDPHLYQPQRDAIKKIQAADIVFYCGLNLEGQMSRLFEQQAGKGRKLFAVTSAVETEYLRKPDGAHGHYDPHLWPDVATWSLCVQFIADKMAELDPTNKEDYLKNCKVYRDQLGQLDEYVKTSIASIPESSRYLVTAHDAFGYFSRAYQIPVKSVQGISTESEAGVQDINNLVEFLAEKKIPAIFVESSTPRKNIEAVVEGVKSRGFEIKIGAELFSDAMGETGTYEGTYIGMMDHNATRIAQALGGKVPEGGFQGKLETK